MPHKLRISFEMDSETPIKIPVVDFSQLNLNDPNNLSIWQSIQTDVFKALQEYGCFEASSFVSIDLQESVNDALKQLFDLPLETKRKNTSEIAFHGYVRSPKVPLYESMGIGNPFIPENVDDFTDLMWPHDNPKFRESIKTYSKKLHELDEIVKKMVFESLGLEKYFGEQMKSTSYLLKVMKYRAPEPNESDIGLHTHTDTNIMTILHQDEIGGLEIQMKNGEWVQVKVSPNSLIIVAGETFNDLKYIRIYKSLKTFIALGHWVCFTYIGRDPMWKGFGGRENNEHRWCFTGCDQGSQQTFAWRDHGEVWLNGRLHVPFHRVIMNENMARYSLGFFSVQRSSTLVKTFYEMVDKEHPLLYKPFDYAEFLKFFYKEGGIQSKFALKTYCGVSN